MSIPQHGGSAVTLTRAAAYARVSTKRQAEKQLSIPAQLRAIRAYAEQHDLRVIDEFVDDGYTGRNMARPGLRALLDAVAQDRLDVVVVLKLDRLCRNTVISAALRTRFRANNVRLVSLHEPTGDSAQERLVERFFESLAEFYSDNLSQDIRRGQREVARRGFYPFSQAPVGYRRTSVKDGKSTRYILSPDEKLGPIVSRIFQEYAAGKTAPEIAKELNSAALDADHASRWTQKRLYYLLRNRAYCGDVVIGRRDGSAESLEIISEAHEPLTQRSTFARVQAIMNARASNHALPRWESSPYMLSGLVRCGLCGWHMVGESAKAGRYRYYTCQQYHKNGKDACPGIRVAARDLEALVLAQVRELILDDANLVILVDVVNEELHEAQAGQSEKLRSAEQRLRRLQHHLQRHYEALEAGALELEDVAPRIREVREEVRSAERDRDGIATLLEQGRVRAVSLERVLSYASDLRTTLRIGSRKERKGFLAGLIQSVSVDRESIEIEYRLPLPEARTEELLSPVLESVLPGGGGGSRTRVRSYFRSASTGLGP